MPEAWVVVDRFPLTYAGEKCIHHNKLFHFGRELRGVGIGDHEADVVPNHPGFLDAERPGKRMNADRRSLHVQTVRGDLESPMPGRSGAMTVNLSPSSGRMGVHMREVSA